MSNFNGESMSDKYLHYKDVPLVRKTITGLVDSHGRFWGDHEESYRYTECTHRDCATKGCNTPTPKHRNYCEECSEKIDIEKWQKAPKLPVGQGEDFYYSDALDKYFSNWDEIEEESEETGVSIEDMRLYHCQREAPPEVDLDSVYEDVTPEDFCSSDMWTAEIQQACDILNRLLETHPVNCFRPSNYAVDLSE